MASEVSRLNIWTIRQDYFKEYGSQNRYAMLADNVKQPFNEYLGVLIISVLSDWLCFGYCGGACVLL